MSAVIDEIERLGRAVDAGELDPDEAAHRVMQVSDGGLDLVSAADWVRHWRMARDSCDALAAELANRLIAIALDLPRGAR